MKSYTTVLTVAGSDSGGGAGIQADIKTISALGCYAASVITAITAQNTCGVNDVQVTSAELVKAQFESVCSDISVQCIKIGMLGTTEVVQSVVTMLDRYPEIPVVLDPVMVATSGDPLIDEETIAVLKKELIPRSTIVTPNLPEARHLLAIEESLKKSDMEELGRRLQSECGARSVLVKGGHLHEDESPDLFLEHEKGRPIWISTPRVSTYNTHGTGCTLSSAIASYLAFGKPMVEAVQSAKQYVHSAICEGASFKIGNGAGPVHHFWKLWK